MILLNIPAHKGCVNCGECCGIIPATNDELQQIVQHMKANPRILARVQNNKPGNGSCPFRDEAEKRCMIYPVRPVICILMGVCAGMTCKHGNSANIDGRPFLRNHKLDEIVILNDVGWKEITI